MFVNIKDLHPIKVALQLCLEAKVAIFFFLSGLNPPTISEDAIIQDLKIRDGYLDYTCGRGIKTTFFMNDIAVEELDPTAYDRLHGEEGKMEKIIDSMRRERIGLKSGDEQIRLSCL